MEKLKRITYTGWFWLLSLAAAALRLLVVGRIGLSGDEAHYFAYTQHLSLSYFDHPPLVAHIIKLSTLVFGTTEFAVRFPTVVIFILTSYFIFLLARDLFGEKTAFWSVVLLNVTPVFSFLGAVMTVPDAPLSLFWVMFIYLFWKTARGNNGRPWYLLGALLGLGMLSKYNAVLLVPSALLFLLARPERRFWLARKEPYFAAFIAAVIFLPVVVWNMENGYASFGFQMSHGFGRTAPQFSPALLLKCLGAQAGYLSPVLFFIFWTALFVAAKGAFKDRDERYLLLFSFSFPVLFLFNAIASFHEILPHWPAMGYLVLAVGVAQLSVDLWEKRWFRAASYAAWGLGLLLTVLVPVQAVFKVIPPEVFLPKAEAMKIEDGITKAEKVDITNELYGWPEVGKKVAEIIAASPDPKPFVFTHRHYIASQLSFYVPGHPKIYCLSDRVDAYDFWQRDLRDLNGRDGIFVTNDYFYVKPQEIYPFSSWEELPPLDIYRAGRKVRIFWITEGKLFSAQRLPAQFSADLGGSRLGFKDSLRQFDYRLFWLINRDLHNHVTDLAMAMLTKIDVWLGVNTGLVFLVGLIGVVIWRTDRKRFLPEFMLAAGIIVGGGLLVHCIKDFAGRMRPLSVFGDQVNVFSELLYRGSFPSGHSQIAFSVATYLSSRIRKYAWLWFLLAVFIAFSRVYIGVHFPLDVIAGGIIGILTTSLVLSFTPTKKK